MPCHHRLGEGLRLLLQELFDLAIFERQVLLELIDSYLLSSDLLSRFEKLILQKLHLRRVMTWQQAEVHRENR